MKHFNSVNVSMNFLKVYSKAYLFAAATSILMSSTSLALANGDWTHENLIDLFTGQTTGYVEFNDNEHRVQILREENPRIGSVWLYIHRKESGDFDPRGVVEYRIDDGTISSKSVADSERTRLLGFQTFHWSPSSVGFLVWHGQEKEGCGFIGQMLDGQELRLRYQLMSGEKISLAIDTSMAREHVVSGLGIEQC